jgi:hypothetical protein
VKANTAKPEQQSTKTKDVHEEILKGLREEHIAVKLLLKQLSHHKENLLM